MERTGAGRGGHGNGRKPPHSSRGRPVAAALLVLAAHFLLQPVALSFAGGSWLQLSRSRPQASLLPRSFFAAPAPLPTEEELEELEKEDEAAAEAASKILAEAAEKAEEAAQNAAKEADDWNDSDFFNTGKKDGGGSASAFKDVPQDQWLKGKVVNVLPFGILMEVAHPKSGMVFTSLCHISQIARGFVDEKILATFSLGQEVEVRITGVDEDANRLKLTMLASDRQGFDYDWDTFTGLLSSNTPLVAKVSGHVAFGILIMVDEPYGRGMIHKSMLKTSDVPLVERFPLGQELKVNIFRVREGKLDFKLHSSEEEGLHGTPLAFSQLPPNAVLKGTVTTVQDFGLMVEAQTREGDSGAGLLHMSELPDFDPKDYSEGQEIEVMVLRADVELNQLAFSLPPKAKARVQAAAEPTSDLATLRKLPSGTMLVGTIYNIVDFGVFVKVDKPAVTGLVHISSLPKTPLKLTEAYKIGQEMKVYVREIKDNGQVNFGIQVDDGFDLFTKLTPETVLKGTVQVVSSDYGVICDVAMTPDGPWAQGLLHISQLPRQGPPGGYAVGQELEVVVLGGDEEQKRLQLGMPNGKEQLPDSRTQADDRPERNDLEGIKKMPSGTLLPATIQKIFANGVVVQVQQPFAKGLLHAKHMPQTRRSLDEVYEVGQEIKVYVNSVGEGKVNFAMKVEDPLEVFGKLSTSTALKARVRKVLEFGLLVEAELTANGPFATGLLHKSRMTKALKDYSVGEELEVAVEKVDRENDQLGFQLPTNNQAQKPRKNDLEGLKKLPPRAPLTATVLKILETGLIVQVDKPFATGMLQISRISQTRRTLREVYDIGQELEVYVKAVKGTGQVDFGMEVENPLEQFKALKHMKMLRAWVLHVLDFGLIVEAEITPDGPWASGLLHRSRMQSFEKADYDKGQELQVGVFTVDVANKQIAFSQTEGKAVVNTPEIVRAFAKALQPATGQAQPLKGKVTHVRSFGIMLEVDLTPDGPTGVGLLHKAKINGEYRPDDYSIGQEVTVAVHSVDLVGRKIEFTQPVAFEATVVAAHQIGVFVELEAGGEIIEGVVESSAFTSEALKKDPAAFLARGQKVLVRELPGEGRGKFFVFHDEESIVGKQSPSVGEDAPASEAQMDLDEDSGESPDGSDSFPPEINRILSQYEGPLSDNGYDEPDLLGQLNEKEWAEMAQVIGMEPSQAAKLRAALSWDDAF